MRTRLVAMAVMSTVAAAGCGQYVGSRWVETSQTTPPPGGEGEGQNGEVVPAGPPPEQLTALGNATLTRLTTGEESEYSPAVSPDGSTLLVTSIAYAQAEGEQEPHLVSKAIVGIPTDGGTSRTYYTRNNTQGDHASWLPNGRSFVYASDAMGSWSLVRAMSLNPGAATSLVIRGDLAPQLDWPVVSPTGSRVAFETQVSGEASVATSGLDGSSYTILAEGKNPSWSPDGKRIAFQRSINGVEQVMIMDADDGGNLVQVTGDDVDCYQPSWSPDGEWLVFSSNRGASRYPDLDPDSITNLFIVRTDGTELTQLSDGAREALMAVWGPNGNIYFASNDSGNFDIWRLTLH